MQRVLVVGSSGAGKSTFSYRLAERTRLPFISLDAEFWQPGWIETPRPLWREKVAALAANPQWIMDGNYAGSFDIRMPRADTVIWLDYGRGLCLARVLRRTLKSYGRTRREMAHGCPERLDLTFLRYVWSFPAKHRPLIVAALDKFAAHATVVRALRDAEADAVLAAQGPL
jgi:adenylate kinase family enzyme